MFGIGTGEILLILVIALIVLGPEKMPQVARDLGRVINDLRRTSEELQQEILNADRPRTATAGEPSEPAAAPASAVDEPRASDLPDAGAAQAEVATSPPAREAEETEFDREMRLARERIEEQRRAKGS